MVGKGSVLVQGRAQEQGVQPGRWEMLPAAPGPSWAPGAPLPLEFSLEKQLTSLTHSPVRINAGGRVSSAVGVAGLKAGEAVSSVDISACMRGNTSPHTSSVSSCWWVVALWALQKSPHCFLELYFRLAKS